MDEKRNIAEWCQEVEQDLYEAHEIEQQDNQDFDEAQQWIKYKNSNKTILDGMVK